MQLPRPVPAFSVTALTRASTAARARALSLAVFLAWAGPLHAQMIGVPVTTVVAVSALGHHDFALSTNEIPAGWTTIRLGNLSSAVHFALVERMPHGITLEDYRASVAPPFQEGMDLLNAGETDAAMAAFGKLPEWYGEVVLLGGPGLVSTGETAQATMELEPGTYLIECYVKTRDGQFHSYLGMVEELIVTDDRSAAPPPRPTIRMAISGENGIEVDDDIRPGSHTVAVHFRDQTTHEHFLGHDVHLVRLQDDTDLGALAEWMDWTGTTGLQEPAPAKFLGGIQDMPSGSTGYFTVQLSPGRYAWIAEVPDPAGKGMLKVFTVPGPGSGQP